MSRSYERVHKRSQTHHSARNQATIGNKPLWKVTANTPSVKRAALHGSPRRGIPGRHTVARAVSDSAPHEDQQVAREHGARSVDHTLYGGRAESPVSRH